MTLLIGKRKPNNISQGFTLIEILLVVLILAIILGMALPRFFGTFEGLQVRSCAHNCYKLSRYAQERAILDKTHYRLSYESKKRRFVLEKEENDQFSPIQSRVGQPIKLTPNVEIKWQGKPTSVTFTPHGETHKAKIYFLQDNDRRYLLTIGEPLGRITLEKK